MQERGYHKDCASQFEACLPSGWKAFMEVKSARLCSDSPNRSLLYVGAAILAWTISICSSQICYQSWISPVHTLSTWNWPPKDVGRQEGPIKAEAVALLDSGPLWYPRKVTGGVRCGRFIKVYAVSTDYQELPQALAHARWAPVDHRELQNLGWNN